MTVIQQILLELEVDYYGRPYYMSGNALYRAIARRVDTSTRRSVAVSHGVFVPGEHGGYLDEHSQSGGALYFGAGLRSVESYEDLFLFRGAAQRWLSSSRPRDAHNTHDLRVHGGRVAFSPTVRFGLPRESRNSKRTMTWYVHFYVHDDTGDGNVVPLDEDVLDGLRLGGARNYGLGETSLKDTQTVDLDAIDYATLEDAAGSFELELVSPYVAASEYPGADDQSIPWWWTPRVGGLRRREERLVEDGNVYELQTIDHGQAVEYSGSSPVETAKSGVLRVGTHSRFGFGEFRLRPVSADRVPERAGIAAARKTAGGER